MVNVTVNEKTFDIDGILKRNMDKVKDVIREDWDYIFVVDGEVGSGKSVFAQMLAYYLSEGKINVDSIAFTPEGFKDAVLKAEKYGAVIFDEAFRGLSARAAMTQTNRVIVSMLQEIRQKNLFVFVVIPSIWDVDSYVSRHRMKGLFHVYVDEKRKRGHFRFFTNETMRVWLGKSDHRYKYPRYAAFWGKFTQGYRIGEKKFKRYLVGENAYLKKKESALGNYGYVEKKEDKITAKDMAVPIFVDLIHKKLGIQKKDIAEMVGINPKTLREWVYKGTSIQNTIPEDE